MQNGHVESFHGRLRDECLNANWFRTLNGVRRTLHNWRQEYNCERPHSSLSYRTPAEFRRDILAHKLESRNSSYQWLRKRGRSQPLALTLLGAPNCFERQRVDVLAMAFDLPVLDIPYMRVCNIDAFVCCTMHACKAAQRRDRRAIDKELRRISHRSSRAAVLRSPKRRTCSTSRASEMWNKFGYAFSNSIRLIGIEIDRQLVDVFIGHHNNDIVQNCRVRITIVQVLLRQLSYFLR